ncbi:MAG: hypothetical protein AB2L11_13845 [Syntrophobacteraceae bacterium]
MRTFKLIIFGLIIAFIALFIYQNSQTFTSLQSFTLNLYAIQPMEWQLYLYTLLIFAAVIGCMLGILLMLKPYFKVRRLLAKERQEKQTPNPFETTPVTPAEGTSEVVNSEH